MLFTKSFKYILDWKHGFLTVGNHIKIIIFGLTSSFEPFDVFSRYSRILRNSWWFLIFWKTMQKSFNCNYYNITSAINIIDRQQQQNCFPFFALFRRIIQTVRFLSVYVSMLRQILRSKNIPTYYHIWRPYNLSMRTTTLIHSKVS